MHILIEPLNVIILECYGFVCSVNDVQLMHHCDLKHFNLHLFFYLPRFLSYSHFPDLSNKKAASDIPFSYLFGRQSFGKKMQEFSDLQACVLRWLLLNSCKNCKTGEDSLIFTSCPCEGQNKHTYAINRCRMSYMKLRTQICSPGCGVKHPPMFNQYLDSKKIKKCYKNLLLVKTSFLTKYIVLSYCFKQV